MPLWPILGVTLFAFALAVYFAMSGNPVSAAFTAIGMLGGLVLGVLKNQEDRLRQLEKGARESAPVVDASQDVMRP